MTLPSTQTPTKTSFDPKADLLIAKAIVENAQATSLNLQFARIVAIAKMNIENLVGATDDEFIEFIAPTKNIAAGIEVNLMSSEVVDWNSYQPQSTIELAYANNSVNANVAFDAWFTSIPVTFATGEKFTVVVKTARGTYTREVTIPDARPLELQLGNITKFNVDMSTATFVPAPPVFVKVTFGTADGNQDYIPEFDLGVTGIATTGLEYAFTQSREQVRNNGNYLKGYEGASGAAFWWSTPNASFTIKNINIGTSTNFALSFGAGHATSTAQASISKDGGVTFFDLSASGIGVVNTDGLKTMNFHLESAITEMIQIKLTNIGGASCIFDDIKLTQLDVAGDESFVVNWIAPPKLSTTPDDGGTLTFTANGGTAGTPPTPQDITYTFENADNIKIENLDNIPISTTPSTANSGILTVTPAEYTATDKDKELKIVVNLMKDGQILDSHTINIIQRKALAADAITYNRFTDAALVSGTYIMVASNTDQAFAELGSTRFMPQTVVITTDKIESTTVTDSYTVDIVVTGTTCTIARVIDGETKYVEHLGTSTGLDYGPAPFIWNVIPNAGIGFKFQDAIPTENDRHIGYGGTMFRAYSSGNITMQLYKKD